METYFLPKYLSQIHTVKSSSVLEKLQALTTQTFQVVEMGTGWHVPLSQSRDLCRAGAIPQLQGGSRLSHQPSLLQAAPAPSLHLLSTSHRMLGLD